MVFNSFFINFRKSIKYTYWPKTGNFIFCLVYLKISSRIIEAVLASSASALYFRLLFIAIERGVLSIAAEILTNLDGILSKPVAFLVLIFLRRFWDSTGLVDSKVKDIGLGVFDVFIILLICFLLERSWYVWIISSIIEKSSLDWFLFSKVWNHCLFRLY